MTDDKAFEQQVDKAYEILWAMYRPKNGAEEGCPWDMKKEEKLLTMLNTIDDALGR